MTFRLRLGLAVLALAATGTLYAEGVFKTGWIEAALVIPIGLSLVAQGSLARFLPNVLIFITAISLTLTTLDLLLRPILGPRLHYTPTNFSPHRYPELPIVWHAGMQINLLTWRAMAISPRWQATLHYKNAGVSCFERINLAFVMAPRQNRRTF